MSFEEALERAFRRDSVSGFSTVGPHRADIKIKIGGFPAIDVLSRGQQKTLVAMMQVAQGTGVYRATGQKPVFLVDDIGAELDAANGVKLLSMLADTGLQLFITAINPQDANLEGLSVNNPGWFHVEHGRVARV